MIAILIIIFLGLQMVIGAAAEIAHQQNKDDLREHLAEEGSWIGSWPFVLGARTMKAIWLVWKGNARPL